jgi:hypothetical protein
MKNNWERRIIFYYQQKRAGRNKDALGCVLKTRNPQENQDLYIIVRTAVNREGL